MWASGTLEIIRHFAGYMHVYNYAVHFEDLLLDPAYAQRVGVDEVSSAPSQTAGPTLFIVPIIPALVANPLNGDTGFFRYAHVHYWAPPVVWPSGAEVLEPPYALNINISQPLLFAANEAVPPSVAASENLNVQQINALVADNVLGMSADSFLAQHNGADAPVMVSVMLSLAQALTPSGLDTVATTGNIVNAVNVDPIGLVNGHDAALSHQPSATLPSAPTGEYVMTGSATFFDPHYGTPMPNIVPLTQPTPPTDINGLLNPGLSLIAGSNSQINAAGILDNNNEHSTMWVLGNSYHTNAIYQVNALYDSTDAAAIGAHQSINVLPDQTGNYAAYTNILNPEFAMGGAGHTAWNVDVVNGNFYNVNIVTQTNVMEANATSFQTTHTSFYQAVLGANDQLNQMVLNANGDPFDLVVVGGNYHNANVIDQTNVVFNSNILAAVSLGSGPGGGASNEGSVSVTAGNNVLTNEASITNFGPFNYGGLSQNQIDQAHGVSNSSFNQSIADTAPGTGNMNVLMVNGDYYDINIIVQVNILSSSVVAGQLMDGGGITGASPTESISAGGNQAANIAQIVDANTIGMQYVGGHQYSDSLIIQANLLANPEMHTDGSNAASTATNALANELVAFISHEASTIPSPVDVPGTTTITMHHDIMGGVMS